MRVTKNGDRETVEGCGSCGPGEYLEVPDEIGKELIAREGGGWSEAPETKAAPKKKAQTDTAPKEE